MERFFRLQRLLGKDECSRLADAHVLIVGLGAVGSYAAESLSRAGIGSFTLVDFDRIALSNINRQLYALDSTIGMYKAGVAEMRIRDINPRVNLFVKTEYINADNIDALLSEFSYSAVVDAIDSVQAKTDLLAAAWKKGLKVFSSMGAALRIDPSKIRVSDIFDTKGCGLARRVRNGLHRQNVGRGITCVYSAEKMMFDFMDPEEEEFQEDSPEQAEGRRVLGSMPTITGIFGLTLANEVILHLAGK